MAKAQRRTTTKRGANGNQDLLVGNDLVASLHEILPRLSRNHRVVARYVLAHLDETAFLTAAKLAIRCVTSEATVIRFAQGLGFPGYPEFQAHIRALVRQKLGPGQKIRRTGAIPTAIGALIDAATEKIKVNIDQTRQHLSTTQVEAAAKALVEARHRYVVGLRGSAGAARTVGFFIGQILPGTTVLTEGGPVLLESLVSVTAEDVLVAVSVPRYTRSTIDALRLARSRGAATIVITDSHLSPAAQTADIALIASVDAMFSNSYAPVLFILDVLVAAAFSLAPDAAHARMDAVEQLFEGHDFFFSTRNADRGP